MKFQYPATHPCIRGITWKKVVPDYILKYIDLNDPAVIRESDKIFKVTMRKSTIGMNYKLKSLARHLGLFRVCTVRYYPVNTFTVGMLARLKHLLLIQCVDEIPKQKPLSISYQVLGRYRHPWDID